MTSEKSKSAHPSSSEATAMLFGLEEGSKGWKLRKEVEHFMQTEILPLEASFIAHAKSDKRWTVWPPLEDLKKKARERGLWNLFLPVESDPERKYGAGLTSLEYAHLAEIMGRVVWASEVFNCSAPDTGNMEVLTRYGTEAQKKEWLIPLLEGRIRSCFAMTEPEVASSDATNLKANIKRDGDHYVINGRKWWTSGAMDPRCKLIIFMGRNAQGNEAPRHQQHSMILIPMDTPGVNIKRFLNVFGYDDAPHGHAEILFENVRVPVSNMLLGEGRGFEIAQGRLGPGRIHHCMRAIGMAERALDLMKRRAIEREAFGRPLVKHGRVLEDICNSRIEIDQARLLTLQAAALMDKKGNKAARHLIAMIKIVAPNVALKVIDRAIQVHGAAGVCDDFVLAYYWAGARTLRIADGPDEVHQLTVARIEMQNVLQSKL